MKNKLFELAILSTILDGGDNRPQRDVIRQVPKNFKKPLPDYRIPPRSMTPAERDYYAIHKNLNGFYA